MRGIRRCAHETRKGSSSTHRSSVTRPRLASRTTRAWSQPTTSRSCGCISTRRATRREPDGRRSSSCTGATARVFRPDARSTGPARTGATRARMSPSRGVYAAGPRARDARCGDPDLRLADDRRRNARGREPHRDRPGAGIYDLRVINEDGGDEFSVIAALQFVRWLNGYKDKPVIHGVNLSLSIHHDVACPGSPSPSVPSWSRWSSCRTPFVVSAAPGPAGGKPSERTDAGGRPLGLPRCGGIISGEGCGMQRFWADRQKKCTGEVGTFSHAGVAGTILD